MSLLLRGLTGDYFGTELKQHPFVLVLHLEYCFVYMLNAL